MVRHEAAEALGAIGTADAVARLEAFADSDAVMLRESCQVALDAADYWAAGGAAAMEGEGGAGPAPAPAVVTA